MKSRPVPLLIIINADDLGASLSVNEAIFRELGAGRVTSTTLMANGPAFEDAVGRVGLFPEASVGVHLNLTEYEPLSATPALKTLLDGDGRLHPGLRYRLFTPRQLRAIYHEFSAQIRRALQAGVKVSHLDSHWHIHTRLDFLPIVKALQRDFGIRRIRARLNIYPLDQPPRLQIRLALPMCNAALRSLPATRTTDRMARLSVFVDRLAAGHKPQYSSIELMVHPGLSHADYAPETALLACGWTALLSRPFRLATFRDI
ncbi:MAG: ChbG/HpnK family deacetylase [Terracidiphilus sp.]